MDIVKPGGKNVDNVQIGENPKLEILISFCDLYFDIPGSYLSHNHSPLKEQFKCSSKGQLLQDS